MAEIIKGAEVAAEIRTKLTSKIENMNLSPCLGIIRVGSNESDLSYERGLKKTCGSVGINVNVFEFPENIRQSELEEKFRMINDLSSVHGILVFRPLPEHLSEDSLAQIINPEKDMDCMSPSNWAKLAVGDESGYAPCTAEAVVKICEYAGINFAGADVVIIGRSLVVGRPLGYMLIEKHATVTWCHTKTKDVAAKCAGADILVGAAGRPNLIGKEYASSVSRNCIAIDVGINFVDGKMCGDFNFDEVSPYVSKITPVPGGVGAVTNTVLAEHVVRAAERMIK